MLTKRGMPTYLGDIPAIIGLRLSRFCVAGILLTCDFPQWNCRGLIVEHSSNARGTVLHKLKLDRENRYFEAPVRE
jgi:hypothetical protein